jgi:choline kinase
MKAIILAAGRGSRMGELTSNNPKGLTLLHGKPILQYQLDALHKAGIYEIAIVTGYKAENFKDFGTVHFHNEHWSETNMVYSLLCAQEWLEEDDCIISYSDIFYESDIITKLIESNADIAISYDPNWLNLWSKRFENPLEDAESFCINSENYLTEIGAKVLTIEEIQGQYMGLLKFRKKVISDLVETYCISVEKIDMTSLLNTLLKCGIKIKAIPNESCWGEIDSESDLNIY